MHSSASGLISAAHLDAREALDPRAYNLDRAAYNTANTCRILDTSRTELWELTKAGRLKPKKQGKKNLFLAIDIARYLASLSEAA
jgi:hypothetical protein